MRESTVERYLCRKVKERGGWAIKLISPNVSGLPDRLVLLPGGRMFFAEMKRPGGKLRPLQEHICNQLRKLGFRVEVIDSSDMTKRILEEVMR